MGKKIDEFQNRLYNKHRFCLKIFKFVRIQKDKNLNNELKTV